MEKSVTQQPEEVGASLDELIPQIRRVARLVTGSREGVEIFMKDVTPSLEALDVFMPPADFRAAVWSTCCDHLMKAQSVDVSSLAALTPESTQADRLARALAALPIRKRLAISLRHQTGMRQDELSEALGLSADEGTALVTAAEAHLQMIVSALGDTLKIDD